MIAKLNIHSYVQVYKTSACQVNMLANKCFMKARVKVHAMGILRESMYMYMKTIKGNKQG